jgi:hypothetical protein
MHTEFRAGNSIVREYMRIVVIGCSLMVQGILKENATGMLSGFIWLQI